MDPEIIGKEISNDVISQPPSGGMNFINHNDEESCIKYMLTEMRKKSKSVSKTSARGRRARPNQRIAIDRAMEILNKRQSSKSTRRILRDGRLGARRISLMPTSSESAGSIQSRGPRWTLRPRTLYDPKEHFSWGE